MAAVDVLDIRDLDVDRHTELRRLSSLHLWLLVRRCEKWSDHPVPDQALHELGTVGELLDLVAVQSINEPAVLDPQRPVRASNRGNHVHLRAVDPAVDNQWLYHLWTRNENLMAWRDQGQMFRIEEWHDRLWSGIAAQFVVVGNETGTTLGLTQVYHLDERNAHARFAVIFDDRLRTSDSVLRAEGIGLTVTYAFRAFRLHKMYAEVAAWNWPAFQPGEGIIFTEEGRLVDYAYMDGRMWDVHIIGTTRDHWT